MHHSGGISGGTNYFGGRCMHITSYGNTNTGTNNNISRTPPPTLIEEESIWIIWEIRSFQKYTCLISLFVWVTLSENTDKEYP